MKWHLSLSVFPTQGASTNAQILLLVEERSLPSSSKFSPLHYLALKSMTRITCICRHGKIFAELNFVYVLALESFCIYFGEFGKTNRGVVLETVANKWGLDFLIVEMLQIHRKIKPFKRKVIQSRTLEFNLLLIVHNSHFYIKATPQPGTWLFGLADSVTGRFRLGRFGLDAFRISYEILQKSHMFIF